MAIAWNSTRLCTWNCDGIVHGLRLQRCVLKPRPNAVTLSGLSETTSASASSSTTHYGVDEEAWRLLAEGVCDGGSRKMSVVVRAPPLDVFLTLMAALNGSTPQDKNESSFTNGNNGGYGGGAGMGGCGICGVGNKDILANSIFSSVLGRCVSSIHNLKKIDEHSDILHIRFHQSDVNGEGRIRCDKCDSKVGRTLVGLSTFLSAFGVGLLDLIGLNHVSLFKSQEATLESMLSDGDGDYDGNAFFYSSSSSTSSPTSYTSSPLTCCNRSESSFWSGALGKLVALIVGKAPRELVVERFWRVDEDG
jgi:hypothetical protein